MKPGTTKREEAFVGLFVLAAAGLLTATLFSLSGFLSRADITYRAYFKNAGGLRPGAEVRYAGGPPVGRVRVVRSDPKDATRMEIVFRVKPDVPVKTDSGVSITSTSPLSENFLGIVPGTNGAPRAPDGSVLKSTPYVGFADIEAQLNDLAPQAKELIGHLNQRVQELQMTVARVNDLLNDRNRANLSASLDNVRGIMEENRPALHSTITHLDDATAKLSPLMDDFKKTVTQAQDALNHIDATVVENRPDLRASIAELRKALANADSLTDQLNSTLETNSDNIDDIIENMRHASQNLRQFTETIKMRPYTLIRSAAPKRRVPGQKMKEE